MVRRVLVRLDALPLTPTGTVDRRRSVPDREAAGRFVAPRDELEAAIARLWAGVLGVERAVSPALAGRRDA